MAAQNEVPTPAGPQFIYLNGLPAPDNTIDSQLLSARPAAYSILQLKINAENPNRAEGVTAPGSDPQLMNGYHATLRPLFELKGVPQVGQEFIHNEVPAQFERQGDKWKLTTRGQVSFSDQPQQAATETKSLNQALEAGSLDLTRDEAASQVKKDGEQAPRVFTLGQAAPTKARLEETEPENQAVNPKELQAKDQAAPAPEKLAATEPHSVASVGELQIKWQQQGDAVAPLLEMRAYLDQFQDAGVAVGPMKFERSVNGKLHGSFSLCYDPASAELAKVEGTIQGLKRVGNGLTVEESSSQVVARRQKIGITGQDEATDLGYSVKEAFGVQQWDALSAHLSQAPKQALTGPEQAQQVAGAARVEQLARQQGKLTEQVVKEGKSLLDIDTSGNPVSAFLKNFYAHLNGAPVTRQSLEVDYDKTQQDLQARLLLAAGNATAHNQRPQALRAQAVTPTATPTANNPAAATPEQQASASQPLKFTAADLPQKVLASMGLTVSELAAQGQLPKLLNGDKTDLLTLRAGGPEQESVKFQAKLTLQRDANGTATLKMELPKRQLTVPSELGGRIFTIEQRQRLATEGTAGLVRGLKDAQGNSYNGYVGIDKAMNKVVVLPESKVQFKDTIAGVKLSPEQSRDLREGKIVSLAQMKQPNGGKPFDGTVQIHAAKAGVEVKPAAYELPQQLATKATRPLEKVLAVKATPKVRGRGPRE